MVQERPARTHVLPVPLVPDGLTIRHFNRKSGRRGDTKNFIPGNTGLEQLFGSQRYHELRATGRKMASPATVLRGEVVWFVPAYLQMSCTSQFIRNRRRFS